MQYIIRLEWFIILVLLQVLVLNHIHFEQYAVARNAADSVLQSCGVVSSTWL